MQHDFFISYAREDLDFAVNLQRELEDRGFRTWRDSELRAGAAWSAAIDEAITAARGLIIVVTTRSMTSRHVFYELGFAAGAGLPIVPVFLEQTAEQHAKLPAAHGCDFTRLRRPWVELIERLGRLEPRTARPDPNAPAAVRNAVAMLDDVDRAARKRALESLAEMSGEPAHEALYDALRHQLQDVRCGALRVLVDHTDERAPELLIRLLREDSDDRVRASAAWGLGTLSTPEAFDALLEATDSADGATACFATIALGALGEERAVPDLASLAAGASGRAARPLAAIEALGRIDSDAARRALLEVLLAPRAEDDAEEAIPVGCACAALAGEERAGIPFLIDALERGGTTARYGAAKMLGRLEAAGAVAALAACLASDEEGVFRTFRWHRGFTWTDDECGASLQGGGGGGEGGLVAEAAAGALRSIATPEALAAVAKWERERSP